MSISSMAFKVAYTAAVKADKICSFIPVVGSITGVLSMIAKGVFSKTHPPLTNGYSNYLSNKSWEKCIVRSIPFVGTVHALYFAFKKEKTPQQAEIADRFISTPEAFIDCAPKEEETHKRDACPKMQKPQVRQKQTGDFIIKIHKREKPEKVGEEIYEGANAGNFRILPKHHGKKHREAFANLASTSSTPWLGSRM